MHAWPASFAHAASASARVVKGPAWSLVSLPAWTKCACRPLSAAWPLSLAHNAWALPATPNAPSWTRQLPVIVGGGEAVLAAGEAGLTGGAASTTGLAKSAPAVTGLGLSGGGDLAAGATATRGA